MCTVDTIRPPPSDAAFFYHDADDHSDAVMGDAFWVALAAEGRPHPTRDDVNRALSKAYAKVADSDKLRERDEAELVRARKVGRLHVTARWRGGARS